MRPALPCSRACSSWRRMSASLLAQLSWAWARPVASDSRVSATTIFIWGTPGLGLADCRCRGLRNGCLERPCHCPWRIPVSRIALFSPGRTAMSAPDNKTARETPDELVYGLNDRPRPWVAFLAALQHLLAIIVPIVTPGLLICQAIGVSPRDTNIIVSMSLVISGIATFVQCKRFGPFGAGLLIVQGTSFNFVGPLIAGGVLMVQQGTPVEAVMAAIFGVVIAGSFIEMGISRVLPFVKRMITPLVTGIVVLMIGLTLIKVGLISMGGGFTAMGNGTFANGENLLMSGVVLAIIVVLNRIPVVWMRSCAIVIALAVGYALAGFLGRLDFTGMHEAALFQVPTPLHFGLGFSWALFIPMLVIYLVTSLEAIGDVTATSKVSRQPVEGPVWMQRI